ncbi:MAG: class I tRNA ligase family protein, partial [Pseudomonadota bacterium]
AQTLAEPAIEAVKSGKTKFVPATWEKTYFNWMENIQPWCVSRQLWWGHQIPAWYGPVYNDGEHQPFGYKIFVAENENAAKSLANDYYTHSKFQGQAGKAEILISEEVLSVADAFEDLENSNRIFLKRDPDVLDTWFSSALWPFATMGWPEEGDALGLEKYYPGSVLVTGFDIIFFWVARMMMQGIHFMDDVPFGTVYIHALVRDEHGQKMSKSKGNVVDPLTLIEKYGADALRFTLAAMETQGRDIKLSEKRVEGYRNFGTKLWNASRFCQMNGISGAQRSAPPKATLAVNAWILGETAAAIGAVTKGLDQFRFSDAANAIYQFTWNTFCDWYVELTKPIFQDGSEDERAETRVVAGWVLDQIFVLLHPFMPFLSEELWHAMGEDRAADLILSAWPDAAALSVDRAAQDDVNWLIKTISAIRTARAESNVPASAMMSGVLLGASDETKQRFASQAATLKRMARLEATEHADAPPEGAAVQVVLGETTLALPLAGVIDLGAERARLSKTIEKLEKEAASIKGRLSNEKFLAKAPEAVVKENRDKLAAQQAEAAKLQDALARLG